jgi:hypothetical protein
VHYAENSARHKGQLASAQAASAKVKANTDYRERRAAAVTQYPEGEYTGLEGGDQRKTIEDYAVGAQLLGCAIGAPIVQSWKTPKGAAVKLVARTVAGRGCSDAIGMASLYFGQGRIANYQLVGRNSLKQLAADLKFDLAENGWWVASKQAGRLSNVPGAWLSAHLADLRSAALGAVGRGFGCGRHIWWSPRSSFGNELDRVGGRLQDGWGWYGCQSLEEPVDILDSDTSVGRERAW